MRRISTPELAHANVCAWAVVLFLFGSITAPWALGSVVLSHYVAKHFERRAAERHAAEQRAALQLDFQDCGFGVTR